MKIQKKKKKKKKINKKVFLHCQTKKFSFFSIFNFFLWHFFSIYEKWQQNIIKKKTKKNNKKKQELSKSF